MPPQVQPVDLLDLKTLQPTELRTAELAITDQWSRERAFYMAGVFEAETLQEMRDLVRLNVTGEAGEFELLKRWEAFLDRKGYTPAPGTEGTIKDLRSLRRFNIALRTNTALLHEWAAKENDLRPGPMRAFPAFELVRLQAARVPRDWAARFVAAGGTITADGRMIAGKLDLVWSALGDRTLFPDALGVDYPPFAWGSVMGRTGIGASEAMELGIVTKEDINAAVDYVRARPLHSPSEDLQLTPKVRDADVREALGEKLAGLAEWAADEEARSEAAPSAPVLVFTDPNGTRPYALDDLARIWSRPLPARFHEIAPEGQIQRQALLDFAEDPETFLARPDRDRYQDLQRALWRSTFPAEAARLARELAAGGTPQGRGILQMLTSSPAWNEAIALTDLATRAVGILRAILAL